MKQMIVLCLLVCTTGVWADTSQHYNQVHLQSQQSEAVSNDTMHVTLGTYAEQRDPASLASKINEDMQWALSKAKQVKGVKISTGSYRTWPVTNKKVTTGWRGQQSLELESKDTGSLAQLAGELQDRLQIKSMNFTVSDDKRMAVENRLIESALNAFKERARIVGDNLQAKGYRIVDINIGTSGHAPPVVYRAKMAMAMEASDAVAVEGGESDVRVTVSGAVELIIP